MKDSNERCQRILDNSLALTRRKPPFLLEQDKQTRITSPFLARLVRDDINRFLRLDRQPIQVVSQVFSNQERDGINQQQHRHHLFHLLLPLVHQPGQAKQPLQIAEGLLDAHPREINLACAFRFEVAHHPQRFSQALLPDANPVDTHFPLVPHARMDHRFARREC